MKRYGARMIGGLQLKMPDSIADEIVLKKSMEQNKKLVYQATLKIVIVAKKYKENNPTQEGLSWFSRCIVFFGQRLYFGYKTKKYCDKVRLDNTKFIGCMRCISICPTKNLIEE